jgi:hypothetical protein
MTFAQYCWEKEVNHMRKRMVLLSVTTLFAFTLTFAGCGKEEQPAPPPPPPAGGEQKAPAEQPGGAMQPEKKEEKAKTK